MWRLILGLFLIVHGLVHLVMWVIPFPQSDNGVPFDPRHSWLMSGLLGGDTVRLVSVILAAAAIAFVAGGRSLLVHQGWWRPLVIGAALTRLALIALCFHPWLSAGLGLEVVIVLALIWAGWPSQELVGA